MGEIFQAKIGPFILLQAYYFSGFSYSDEQLLRHQNSDRILEITHMGTPETIRIFEFSMALLMAERTF